MGLKCPSGKQAGIDTLMSESGDSSEIYRWAFEAHQNGPLLYVICMLQVDFYKMWISFVESGTIFASYQT